MVPNACVDMSSESETAAAGIVTATRGATTMTFTGVVSIAAAGTANADALQLNGALTTPA